MDSQLYQKWLETARKLSTNEDDARELLHEALEVAIRQGRIQISSNEHAGWFYGVLRNLRALDARSSARRKNREQRVMADAVTVHTQKSIAKDGARKSQIAEFVSGLSPALRAVVVLHLHGLTDREIQTVLHISATAYRKRLQKVRENFRRLPVELQEEFLSSSSENQIARAERFDLGLMRNTLLKMLKVGSSTHGEIGTHDPDGHLLIFGSAAKNKKV